MHCGVQRLWRMRSRHWVCSICWGCCLCIDAAAMEVALLDAITFTTRSFICARCVCMQAATKRHAACVYCAEAPRFMLVERCVVVDVQHALWPASCVIVCQI
ncbi:hypothetical protein COO60DRAFT_1551640 [Scenedesmus sp. NREL 46B-D3]|nr:hypothetical protein COO60DRAFT_1551640 [Scenedesmus sp. NREL 46B-D3]